MLPTPVPLPGHGRVCSVSCGDNHTVAVCEGRVLTWGCGLWGRLGHGNQEDCLVPTAVDALRERPVQAAVAGGYHTLVLHGEIEKFSGVCLPRVHVYIYICVCACVCACVCVCACSCVRSSHLTQSFGQCAGLY